MSAPRTPVEYKADLIRLPAGNRIRAADREVAVAFVLANPNIALLDDLLSRDECQELVRLASGRMRPSMMLDHATGKVERSRERTSEGARLARGESAVVDVLERRIAALTGVPVECGEPPQVLRYRVGDEYRPHDDYFDPALAGSEEQLRHGGQRVATVVVYLNDVEEGGDTSFPDLGLSVRPRAGCALYFEYFNAAGDLDRRCLHAGTPVTRGEKWILTKWLRQGPYLR